jgi:DNA-binding GntR family transcriptional regulator
MMLDAPDALLEAIPEGLARRLEDEIIFGRLEPLTRLTEEDVALRYGVSRSPVREALRLLERDGLVNRAARRGIWVAPMSLRDFDEVYTCRIPLEGIAAAQAARSTAAACKERSSSLLDQMREARAAGDARRFFLADVQGSKLIYELADNATLRRLLASLEKQALRYRFFAYARNADIVGLSADATERIFGCIVAGDAERARELTEELIGGIRRTMRPLIAESFGDG